MLKNLLLGLFCLLALAMPSFGQRAVSVSATVAPTLVRTQYKRTYLYPESDGQVVEPVYLKGPVNAFGYTAGLTAQYSWAPGWSVAAGLWYTQATLRQARPVAVGEGITAVRSQALRVPFLLNFQPSTRRLSPYFSLGLLLDFPLTGRVIVTRTGQSTQSMRLLADRGPVFQPMIGAGGRYQLARRCALIVQPVWAYNIGSFGGARSYTSAYEISLLTQINYSF